jgi:hypothetical protein
MTSHYSFTQCMHYFVQNYTNECFLANGCIESTVLIVEEQRACPVYKEM